MKKLLLLPLLLAMLAPVSAASLNLSKMPAHYAREMEFYYQKPRPAMLAPMLVAFDRAGQLENAEKRMFIAAFLCALSRRGSLKIPLLLQELREPSPGCRATLAWAARLSGTQADYDFLPNLLAGLDATAAAQIRNGPAPLTAWDPAWEKSSLNMHWGAFMATGENIWLDAIIRTALGHARGLKGGREAAASIYDYAPRHAAIVKRLAETPCSAIEQQLVERMLAGTVR